MNELLLTVCVLVCTVYMSSIATRTLVWVGTQLVVQVLLFAWWRNAGQVEKDAVERLLNACYDQGLVWYQTYPWKELVANATALLGNR